MKTTDRLNILIIGTGYVGLTTGLALSYLGHQVTCADKNEDIINKLLQGISPIYEPGLEELLSIQEGQINFVRAIPGLKQVIFRRTAVSLGSQGGFQC